MAEEPTNQPIRRTERIGKYEILDLIATGGMGVIYKARDVALDRLVALKLLPADLAAQPATLIRFHREAKAAARLRHENIVAIFDVGESDGRHFIALEFIEGGDLQNFIDRKSRLDPEEARQIIIQAARALKHAHEQGIVHRDIKPSNFLVTHTNNRLVVKLTDFGLAIRYENDAEFRITRDKTTVGTVDYMSPEQARDSRSVDIRSDIYSLGCTFYHMLAGQAPFARGTLPERIVQHMQDPPPDMRRLNKGVPQNLQAIIERMLAKKPAHRYQTPAELLHDLEHPETVVKRAPAVGKLERGAGRGPAQPTQVIDTRPAKPKKPANPKPTPRPEPREQPAPNELEEIAQPIEEQRRPVPLKQRKRAREQSPVWMYAIAGSIVVLGVALVITLALSHNPPEPEKPPEKPPPIVKLPDPEPEKPPAIDTSPSKMTVVQPMLPIMEARGERSDFKEFHGPFTAFPTAVPTSVVLRVSRLATPGSARFRTLAEAFNNTKPGEFTVIEIRDNGPIFIPSLPPLTQRELLIRGAAGYRPLMVWEAPKKTQAAAFCSLSRGKLILENLDFVTKLPDEGPAVWFEVTESDFHARDCTFSTAGTPRNGAVLVSRKTGEGATQTWLKRCYVRGSDLTLLRQHEASTAVMLEDSLIVGHQHSMIQVRGRDNDSLALYCVRSTVVTGQTLLHWQTHDGTPGAPMIKVRLLDSILSRDDFASEQGDLVHLADGSEPIHVNWQAANSVYAGWKRLLASSSRNIAGGDLEGWHNQWRYRSGDCALVENWPASPPSALEEQSANAFFPGQSPAAFAALTSSVAAGCVIGLLPPVPEAWIERAFEPRAMPSIPNVDETIPRIDSANDGLYHGERLDLNKVDLGVYLAGKKSLAPRVVLHLAGKGVCQTSPLRIAGVQHLVLFFEEPLVLEGNATNVLKSPAMIEMTGGHLELIGLRVRLSPITAIPTVVHLKGSSLTMSRCWLQGPLTNAAAGFQNMIAADNANGIATTLLLRDNIVISGKTLIDLQDHVELRARNNVFLSLGDGIHFGANRPTVPLSHALDHNTFAVRKAFFTLNTGPEFQPVGSVSLQANSNAFLHPFKADDDKAIFLRGGDAWVSSGRWNWQGRYNVYDSRIHTYLGDNGFRARQTLRDWQNVWGQAGEVNALAYEANPASKLITTDTASQLDRLALPKSLRGDLNQTPPGVDPGLLKRKG